ncbi:MAG: hypothetical protein JW806_03205 [Sedimentisphaerales bacterium]|nr:hypothetical protein [Sedimentisphaerales bacterium]
MKIRIPVLLPIVLTILILLSSSVIGVSWLQWRSNTDKLQIEIEGARLLYNRYVNTHTQEMDGLFDFIKEDEGLKSAWLKKNRAKLLELSKPILNGIYSKGKVTHLYFHDLDKNCFLRVHNPARHGDTVTRPTVNQAEKWQRPVWGTEFDPYGTLTVRVVHPWVINGELSGYIEIGEDIGYILPVLKEVLDVELLITVDKECLQRANWEQGMRMIGRENANWDLLSDKVIAGATLEDISEKSLYKARKVLERNNDSLFSTAITDRSYKGGFIPLVNAAHIHIGDIVVLKDMTPIRSAMEVFIMMLTSIAVAAGAVSWLLSHLYMLRAESKLAGTYMDLYDKMEQQKKIEEKLQQAYNQKELDVAKRTSELRKEVAERKKTQAELQKLNTELETTIKRLTVANQELEQFAFITSHHLREPVRKISMFGRLLARSLTGKLDTDQQENLSFMIDGAMKIEQMVKGLRLYLQVSVEKMEFEDIDLNLVMENIRSISLADEIEQMHAVISVPRKLPVISGCPVKLHQVMEQIIANGLRFRKEDVPLEIIVQAFKEDDQTVRIEIEDNGMGIREEQLGNVFDPFKRLQHIDSETEESVGIGLTVCKKIVERHGGQMGIRSVYEHGTTIWFTLPLATNQKVEDPPVTSSAEA